MLKRRTVTTSATAFSLGALALLAAGCAGSPAPDPDVEAASLAVDAGLATTETTAAPDKAVIQVDVADGGSNADAEAGAAETSSTTASSTSGSSTTDAAQTTVSSTTSSSTSQAPTTAPSTTSSISSTTTVPSTTTTSPPTTTSSTQPPSTSGAVETRPEILALALPTYGGGNLDPDTMAGKNVILWFWGAH